MADGFVNLTLKVDGSYPYTNDQYLVCFMEYIDRRNCSYFPLKANDRTYVMFKDSVSVKHYLIVCSKVPLQFDYVNTGAWQSSGDFLSYSEYGNFPIDPGISVDDGMSGFNATLGDYLASTADMTYIYFMQSSTVSRVPSVSIEMSTVSTAKKITYDHQAGDGYFNVQPASPISLSSGTDLTVSITPVTSYRFTSEAQSIFLNGVEYALSVDGNVGSVTIANENVSDGDVITFNIHMEEIPVPRRNFYTVYAPTPQNLVAINNAIFLGNGSATVDVSQYFSSYRKFWCNLTLSGNSRELMAGRYDFGEQSPTIDEYIQTIDCGSIDIEEVKKSLVDYNPYSRIVIYLPFIGFNNIQTSEFMGRKLRVKYKVDVLNGRCLAELYTDIISPETCVAQYQGTIASDEIFGLNNGFSYDGTYELMTTNQLGGLVPFVLIYTKDAIDADIKDYDGLPASEEKIVGNCDGFVKFDSIKVEGTNAKKSEIDKIETLLLNGIYV